MLYDFIRANRDELIARTRAKVAKRLAPRPTEKELASGVPLVLDQLTETLRGQPFSRESSIELSGAAHGAALFGLGYTVAQVVRDYGDICQAVTELAVETDAPITTEEFHTLNRCLDDAIAGAMTEYSRLREQSTSGEEAERSGVFAHELRNRVQAALLAFESIRAGRAPIGGSVATVVTRSLRRMSTLIDRSLVEVRLDSGITKLQRMPLHRLLEEAEVDATLEAGVHGVSLTVMPADRTVDVNVDPHIVAGAVANLLQNAFKYTHAGGHVALRSLVTGGRVAIAVEDECGGLPPGKAEELFGAFEQRGKDRRGLGLGLFISRRGIEANGGHLRVRDVPGSGCVFTIDLPLAS